MQRKKIKKLDIVSLVAIINGNILLKYYFCYFMSKKQILIGNSAVLKKVNKVRLLNELWFNCSISRASLSRRTGLDAKTITNICNELLAEKLIFLDEVVVSGRGRPSGMLKLNPRAMYSVGIDIGASHITAIIIDFAGNVIDRQTILFMPIKTRDYIVKKLKPIIDQLINGFQHKGKIKAIGLSFPGFLDRENGKIINSVNFNKIADFQIVSHIEKMTGLPVFLDESSRMMALGELWFGEHGDVDNFICVDLGYGIGMGIVQNGLLYRGFNEISGEIGHIMIDPDGKKCRCGKKGCLETIAGGKVFYDMALKLNLDKYGINSFGGRAIFEAAEKNDKRAVDVLQKVGYSIGIAIANVITLIDPGFVIVGGGLMNASKYILEPMQNAVQEHSVSSLRKNPKVMLSKLGEDLCAMGASIVPIKEYFEFENIRL